MAIYLVLLLSDMVSDVVKRVDVISFLFYEQETIYIRLFHLSGSTITSVATLALSKQSFGEARGPTDKLGIQWINIQDTSCPVDFCGNAINWNPRELVWLEMISCSFI